jgi:indole-3-glycerol phosphate synthase
MSAPVGILERIVETKRQEVEGLEDRLPELRAAVERADPPRDFFGALSGGESVAVIAEIKRRSPGAGPIRPDLDPLQLAPMYERGGASALSVLTDRDYFGGSVDDLITARGLVSVPVLRKDFIIDESQIYEARAAGADAILLIARILDDTRLRSLRLLAEELGMTALVEAHDDEEVDRAVASGAALLGVNNRNLKTFETRLDVTLGLLERIPPDVVMVSESGIRTREDVRMLGERGVHAVLVGESLLRQDDPGEGVSALAGELRRARSHG